MRVRALSAALLLVVPVLLAASQSYKNTAPESFKANAQATGAPGGVAAIVVIQIDRYTSDADHETMAKALKEGGNAAFVAALRKAPVVGAVKVGDRSVPIRWARQRAQGDGRHIAVVTDAPIYFLGAGAVDAKPTAGYDIAALEFTSDPAGLGKGTLAPAATVKAGGDTGVQVDDYSGTRMTLVTVTRDIK